MESIELQGFVPKKIETKSGNKEYSLQINKAGQKVLVANTKDKYKNFDKETVRSGTLVICHSNIILYQFILETLSRINELLIDVEKTTYFLQGLIAGDGSLKCTQTGSIDNVSIGAIELKEKKLIVSYLKNIGIESSFSKGDKNAVRIFNRKNFFKIYEYGLFDLHKERKHRFLKGLIRFKYSSSDISIKENLFRIQKNINEVDMNG